jgi:L-ascorbate metabolism protein UlaG (beta-lactamase superfamily)
MAGKRDLHSSLWELTAVRADVERDPVTTLPNGFVFTEPRRTTLFAYDTKPKRNELSSAEEESSGTIRVELADCDVGDPVRLTFDHVVLGSELHDLGSLSFDGEVAVVISNE